MKKWLCLALALGAALALGSVSRAQTAGLEAHGLFAFGFDGTAKDRGDDDIANAFGFGGGMVFCLGEYVKVDVGGDWVKTKDEDLDNSKITLIPVTAALRVGGHLDMVYAYVGGGAGYSFNSFNATSAVKSYFGSDVKLKDAPIYFALAGAEIGLSEQLVLRGEFRYNWLNPDLELTDYDYKTNVNLDHMQLRVGFGLYF